MASVLLALACAAGAVAIGAAPSAVADTPVTVTGRVTVSNGTPMDARYVIACPTSVPYSANPLCAGGALAFVSDTTGRYQLTLPSAGEWEVRSFGLFCGAPYAAPALVAVLAGATTHDFVIDASSFVAPPLEELVPPFADGVSGAAPVPEDDASDDVLHLALQDPSRTILVGAHNGGCRRLHVAYRPLTVLVKKPAGPGPFPLLVLSHGSGQLFPNPGLVAAADQYVAKGYAVAVPTYPLSASYVPSPVSRGWPGAYNRDAIEQAADLALIVEHLTTYAFVDDDRVGLSGVSLGGFTSIMSAFHERGYGGDLRAVATEIARPLTAPFEVDVAPRIADVPLYMANNVDDVSTAFAPADAFWEAATGPKYRWLEDTPAENPTMDHGFSDTRARYLHDLFLDAYLLGDVAARLTLDAFSDDSPPEYDYEAVPTARFAGPLAGPLASKTGRTIPVLLETYGPVGPLTAQVTGPSGATTLLPLVYDAGTGTYEAMVRTRGFVRGTYALTVDTHFGTFATSFTIR